MVSNQDRRRSRIRKPTPSANECMAPSEIYYATLSTRTSQRQRHKSMTYSTRLLATASYALRIAVHNTMRVSPGALVFHRDMLLDVPLIVDLEMLRQQRQVKIDERLRRENLKRISHDYQPGQYAYILTYKPKKLQPRMHGPYPDPKGSLQWNGYDTADRHGQRANQRPTPIPV